MAGERAERLAYLFCVTPRGPLLAGHRWARGCAGLPRHASRPTRDELDALVLLHMANLGRAGARRRRLARPLAGAPARPCGAAASTATRSPSAVFLAAPCRRHRGRRGETRRAYAQASRPEPLTRRLPCAGGRRLPGRGGAVRLAGVGWPGVRGDGDAARSWAQHARAAAGERSGPPGTSGSSFEQWLALIDALERSPVRPRSRRDLRAHRSARHASTPSSEARGRRAAAACHPADAAAGRALSSATSTRCPTTPAGGAARLPRPRAAGRGTTPRELPAGALPGGPLRGRSAPRSWPSTPRASSRESERIGRTGDWDVASSTSAGRRHDDVCAACPVTTRGDRGASRAIRSVAGLIYVSRMRPGTHIAAHRGPTNLRLRCHLGIRSPTATAPSGSTTRRGAWQEGKCLVFDDSFEHEAWNHTDRTASCSSSTCGTPACLPPRCAAGGAARLHACAMPGAQPVLGGQRRGQDVRPRAEAGRRSDARSRRRSPPKSPPSPPTSPPSAPVPVTAVAVRRRRRRLRLRPQSPNRPPTSSSPKPRPGAERGPHQQRVEQRRRRRSR